jgi:hypothetical protein
VTALGPHAAVTWASIIAAITCNLVPTARASSPSRTSPRCSPVAAARSEPTAHRWLSDLSGTAEFAAPTLTVDQIAGKVTQARRPISKTLFRACGTSEKSREGLL